MKQVSAKFLDKMKENLRSWVPRMTINGTEISGDIQTGLTINLGSCGAEEFNIGTVFIPSITATISDCSTVLQNKEIKLEMGLVFDDGTIEYVPVGYFTVEKPNKGKFATSFTAYGRLMSKMGGMYESTLTYPTAINNVLSEISTQTGVTIKLSGLTGTSEIPLKPTGLNYRETVQLIAGLLGGFVTENSAGEVVICKYQLNDALTVDTSFCYEYPFVHDETYAVTGLSVKTDNAEYSYGTPNISMVNGYMSAALFEVCKNNIMGFSYMPGSVHFLGDIRLDPWDSLKVTDDDDVYQIPCMDIVHVWDGGLITTVNAPGTTEAEDGSGFEGSLKALEDKISGIDGVTAAIETLFEIDKIHGTIKLQAGKLLEILSGGTFIVDAENYKLNEDGTVTITGGTIGGFVIDAEDIVKYDRKGNPILMLDGSDFPYFGYKTADILDPQYGKLGWFIDTEYNTYCHGLQISSTDHQIGATTTEISEGIKIFFEPINGEMRSVALGTGGIWSSADDFSLNDSPIACIKEDHINAMINCLSQATGTTLYDDDYFICQFANGNNSEVNISDYRRKKISSIWNYIKSKADNVYAAKGSSGGAGDYASKDHTHARLWYKSTVSEDTSGHNVFMSESGGAYFFLPNGNGTINLGGNTHRWNCIYGKQLYLSESIALSEGGSITIGGKSVSMAGHTHSGYAPSTHKHDSDYSKVGHNHSGGTIKPSRLYVTGGSSLSSGVANVRMILSGTNTGQIVYLTNASSKRFKHDIHPLSEEQKARFRKLYDIEVKNWKYNEDYIGKDSDELGKERYGLIAEDIAEFIPEAVFDDEDGNIENYDDRKILNAMLVLLQEQKRQIDSLEERIEKLEQMLVK